MAALLPRVKHSLHPLLAGGMLIALALLSFGSSFLSLHDWALPLALIVAVAKAAIVALVFMGLGRESASIQLIVVAALLLLLLLAGLMLADPLTREASPVRAEANVNTRTAPARGMHDSSHGNRRTGREDEPRTASAAH